jgi:hypothetical protein
VKQSDLGEYDGNAREKQNIQYTGKTQAPPRTKANHKLPLKPSHMGDKHQVLNSRG